MSSYKKTALTLTAKKRKENLVPGYKKRIHRSSKYGYFLQWAGCDGKSVQFNAFNDLRLLRIISGQSLICLVIDTVKLYLLLLYCFCLFVCFSSLPHYSCCAMGGKEYKLKFKFPFKNCGAFGSYVCRISDKSLSTSTKSLLLLRFTQFPNYRANKTL